MNTRTAPQPRTQPFTLVRIVEWMRRELSWHITSWEDIGSIINGPLLFVAALIAGVNQIEGGALLASLPWLGPSWAILQIVGIDMQYMACARRTKDAYTHGHGWVAFGWLALALVLAVPVLWANVTFSLQLMLGWSDAQAMSLLGLTPLMVAMARAILQALLAFISAITRETREQPTPAPSVHTDQTPPTTPRPRGPSGPGSGTRTTRQNAGVSLAQKLADREAGIATLRAYMDAHPDETLSVGKAQDLTGVGSRSTAASWLERARQRTVSA